VISLEKVRYIDSTGLGVLIGGLKRVREHGGSVNLVCTNPQIRKIFDITGLVKIFGISTTSRPLKRHSCERAKRRGRDRKREPRNGRTSHPE